ncbi:MAG TPA: asparagine--tRNA ligase [Chloroflexia bacterium]
METTHPGYSYYAPALIGAVQPGLSKAAHLATVKAAMLRAAQSTLDREGFTQVVPSMLTTMCGACGDPGTLVPVEVGGKQAYLSQTAQLHLEPLMRELGKVYSISRSFRAERRIDDRHLAEFTLVEGEAAGWDLEQMMELMESLVVNMLRHANTPGSHYATVKAPFARMTYDDAIMALQKKGHFIEWGEDLTNQHEIALTEIAGGPLFVTHYPLGTRFFTMKVCRDDPRVVECCDLLMPGVGEVMGASETEHDPDLLQARLESSPSVRQWLDLGGSTDDYAWYLDMHRHASVQHAGFGLGFERLVRYACGLKSVAEA